MNHIKKNSCQIDNLPILDDNFKNIKIKTICVELGSTNKLNGNYRKIMLFDKYMTNTRCYKNGYGC